MRKEPLHLCGWMIFSLLLAYSCFFYVCVLPAGEDRQQVIEEQDIVKARIFSDAYPLISGADLNCSYFVLEGEMPLIKIVAGEKEREKTIFSDFDVIYIDKGKDIGLIAGQVFTIVEIGAKIKSPSCGGICGYLTKKKAQATIVRLNNHQGLARIEKACGAVRVGDFLIPFQEREGLLGKDQGFTIAPEEVRGQKGTVIYLENKILQAGPGHWAIIDLGSDQGMFPGQQLVVFKGENATADITRRIIGNLIIVDCQRKTSTVKILSCRDCVELEDEVQVR